MQKIFIQYFTPHLEGYQPARRSEYFYRKENAKKMQSAQRNSKFLISAFSAFFANSLAASAVKS